MLALERPPGHRPAVGIVQRSGVDLVRRTAMWCSANQLRRCSSLRRDLTQDRCVLVQIGSRERLARLQRERLRHEHRVMAGEVALQTEVHDATSNVLRANAGFLAQALPTVADLLQPSARARVSNANSV